MMDGYFWFAVAGMILMFALSQYKPIPKRPIYMPGSFVTGWMKIKLLTNDYGDKLQ